jgi:dipeptidyl aminopeptidase/acylaminoacyl peptidase
MSTPQLNKAGYRVSSCVAAADRLHGHLLIVHGSMDDNVHMQNTMQFIHALQKAQKDFELMIYPGARHGLQRHQYPHLRRMQWRAIRQKLLDRD